MGTFFEVYLMEECIGRAETSILTDCSPKSDTMYLHFVTEQQRASFPRAKLLNK